MPVPTALTGMSYAVKINGKSLRDLGILIHNAPNLGQGPIEVQMVPFPERLDAYAQRATFIPRPIVLTGQMFADSAADLRTNLDSLKSILQPTRGVHASIPAKVRLEVADQTDRYWPCFYVGNLTPTSIDRLGTNTAYVNITIPLLQASPYAIATSPTSVAPSGSGISFSPLSLGSAPSPVLVELEGAATAPDFVISNCAFYSDFNYDLGYTLVDGTTGDGTCAASPLSDQFDPGDFEQGRYRQQASATSFASVVTEQDEGTVILAVRPQFAYDTAAAEYLLDFVVDANNGFRLYYDNSTDKWAFAIEKAAATTVTGGSASAESFATDTYMVLVGTFGPLGLSIYKDGTRLDREAGTTTGITGFSGAVTLGDSGGSFLPDCKYEYATVLPYQLDDDDVARLSAVPEDFRPVSVKKSKTGNLAANERSVLDFDAMTVIKLATDLTQTNDLSDWDTNGFPVLQPPKMTFHVPSGETVNGVKVQYRKRWF